jgi:hypothetical protein
MPGHSRSPESGRGLKPPEIESNGPSTVGIDPLISMQSSPGGGNAAAGEMLKECGEGDESWAGMGNLIGAPPVRDTCNPPNKGIVENQSVYNARASAAQGTQQAQQARADSYLDGSGNVTDHRFWFAQVYSFVSDEEMKSAEGGTFYYPSYVMECVRYFDQIYSDNADAWDSGGEVEAHWEQAFQTAIETKDINAEDVLGVGGGTVLGTVVAGLPGALLGLVAGDAMADMYAGIRNLVVSMKAHIRFDLPRAEAWVYNSYYANMEGAQIANFAPDFMSMTPVFDRAAEKMNGVIAEKSGMPTEMVPRMAQDLAMDYWFDANMATERADTWQRAEELVESGEAGVDPYADTGTELKGDVTAANNLSGLETLSSDLTPDMENSAEGYDDDQVRELAGEQGDAGLSKKLASDRIRMIRALMSGATFNDDEATILLILRASVTAGDEVTVIDGAGAWDMLHAIDGAEYDTVRQFFRDNYYQRTSGATAFTHLTRCMDGMTFEWEEEMIADLLCDRADGKTLIKQIGAHYDGGGFDEGLSKVEWQLDGADQDRVAAIHGETSWW